MQIVKSFNLDQIHGILFDLDGTIYLGEAALPGAVETLAEIRRQGISVLLLSNKPLYPRQEYASKLRRLGIPASAEEVITSAFVLGYHLKLTTPQLKLYVIGEENLKDELRSHGLTVLDEFVEQDAREVIQADGVDAVVVAFDRTLDYRKLNTAYQSLMRGARFFATNPDRTCPMPGGAIPDCGATLAALEYLTGRKVELLAGKPSPLMVQVALQRLALPPGSCLMVGDRLETDIRMGHEAGMHTALVLTGVTSRDQASQARLQADLILDHVGQLGELLRAR